MNYVDNEELKAELEKWRDSAARPEDRQPTERLGRIMLDLHDGILRHKNFRYYRQDIKDEMKSWSLLRIFKKGLQSYDFGKNPFSYFTRSVFLNYMNMAMRYYRRLNKHQEYVKGVLARLDTRGDPYLERLVRDWKASE